MAGWVLVASVEGLCTWGMLGHILRAKLHDPTQLWHAVLVLASCFMLLLDLHLVALLVTQSWWILFSRSLFFAAAVLVVVVAIVVVAASGCGCGCDYGLAARVGCCVSFFVVGSQLFWHLLIPRVTSVYILGFYLDDGNHAFFLQNRFQAGQISMMEHT